MVGAFVITYLTEDDFPSLHVYTGYTMIVLISLRVIWGFIGSKHARFSSFVVKPTTAFAYLKAVFQFKAKRYLGHNPAGGLMVGSLLLSLSMTLLFGLLTHGIAEFSGPFSGLANAVSHSIANAFKEVHEFFANFTLILVVLHVFGVLVASLQHKENLIKSMINGNKIIVKQEDQ